MTALGEGVKKLGKMIERTGFADRALAISLQALVVELGDRTA